MSSDRVLETGNAAACNTKHSLRMRTALGVHGVGTSPGIGAEKEGISHGAKRVLPYGKA
jgi:hypothetical protein